MASEYLRKSVADRRTGANLIGIRVDTSNMNNISPDYSIAFKQLEAFARQTDELKIQNEKMKIKLDIERDRLKFRQDYLNNPAVYSSQEEWDKVAALYEQEKQKAKQRIAENKYLTASERELYSKKVDNDFMAGWTEPMKKRNTAEINNRISETLTNIDMITSIASMGDLYDTGIIDRAGNDIINQFQGLIKTGIQTENDMRLVLADKLSTIESTLFKRKIQEEIINNPKFSTVDEKITEINKATEFLGSDERIKEVVDNMGEQWNLSDYDKKYLSVKLKEGYMKSSDVSHKIIQGIQTQERNDNILKNREIEDAVIKKDIYKLEKLTTGKGNLSPSILLNDDSGDLINQFTIGNYDITDFGDIYNGAAFPFLTTGINSEIKGAINRRSKNGNYTYAEAYVPLYETAEKLAGDTTNKISKKKAIIIDFGLRNGIDPNILLKGETNPDVFRVANSMSEGQRLSRDMVFDIDKINLNKTERENFDSIANVFSSDKVLGKRLATQFLIGFIYRNGSMDRLTEYPENELARILSKNQMPTLMSDAKLTSQFTSSRVDYDYVEIKDPRIKEKIEIKTENNKEKVSKQTEAFGG